MGLTHSKNIGTCVITHEQPLTLSLMLQSTNLGYKRDRNVLYFPLKKPNYSNSTIASHTFNFSFSEDWHFWNSLTYTGHHSRPVSQWQFSKVNNLL